MRKIIQITNCCCSDMVGGDISFLNALCDDGSVWEHLHTTDSWYQLSPIPQPTENLEEENEK